jgi:hypothetical protein
MKPTTHHPCTNASRKSPVNEVSLENHGQDESAGAEAGAEAEVEAELVQQNSKRHMAAWLDREMKWLMNQSQSRDVPCRPTSQAPRKHQPLAIASASWVSDSVPLDPGSGRP